jgi:hypothetical protein
MAAPTREASAPKLFNRPRTRGASSWPTSIKTADELQGMKTWNPTLITSVLTNKPDMPTAPPVMATPMPVKMTDHAARRISDKSRARRATPKPSSPGTSRMD